jgi:hypothetical protein
MLAGLNFCSRFLLVVVQLDSHLIVLKFLMWCRLQGKLDKNTPNPGYVLLMFYNLYDGMVRTSVSSEWEKPTPGANA